MSHHSKFITTVFYKLIPIIAKKNSLKNQKLLTESLLRDKQTRKNHSHCPAN